MKENDLTSAISPPSHEIRRQLRELFPEGFLPFGPRATYDSTHDTLTIPDNGDMVVVASPIADGRIELLFEKTAHRIVGVRINQFSQLVARPVSAALR